MAASVPFVTIEQAVASLAKIDVLHYLIGAAESGPPISPGDDYFLRPFAIQAVAEGDHDLWDGASSFVNSSALRFRVGDRVQCRIGPGLWVDGVVNRQPVMDGESEAYDVKLSDGHRILCDDDDDESIRAGEPRYVHHYELIFASYRVRTAHDEALAKMGGFGRDVQLASAVGPPEIAGRCVRQLCASVFEEVSEALYEGTIAACASLLGVAKPANWRQMRDVTAQPHLQLAQRLEAHPAATQPANQKKRGRPAGSSSREDRDLPFECSVRCPPRISTAPRPPTTNAPPPMHHLQCTTTNAPPPMHHHRCITDASLAVLAPRHAHDPARSAPRSAVPRVAPPLTPSKSALRRRTARCLRLSTPVRWRLHPSAGGWLWQALRLLLLPLSAQAQSPPRAAATGRADLTRPEAP